LAGWFLFALLSAIVLVVLGAYGKRQRRRRSEADLKIAARSMAVRGVLTAAAFTLWATLLPQSWPSSWTLVQNLGAAYPLVLALVATVFTFLAESLTRKFKL
jgi:Na+/proline symporter